jgi:hypothetical protein
MYNILNIFKTCLGPFNTRFEEENKNGKPILNNSTWFSTRVSHLKASLRSKS